MNRLHRILTALLTLGLCLSIAEATNASNNADMTATLVLCSNQGKGVDPNLSRYERHLKRLFKFDTYQQKGIGRSSVTIPGSSVINVGDGHVVDVKVADAGNDRLRIDAKWSKGGQVLAKLTVAGNRNQPTVLGGPRSSDGVLILMLVAR